MSKTPDKRIRVLPDFIQRGWGGKCIPGSLTWALFAAHFGLAWAMQAA